MANEGNPFDEMEKIVKEMTGKHGKSMRITNQIREVGVLGNREKMLIVTEPPEPIGFNLDWKRPPVKEEPEPIKFVERYRGSVSSSSPIDPGDRFSRSTDGRMTRWGNRAIVNSANTDWSKEVLGKSVDESVIIKHPQETIVESPEIDTSDIVPRVPNYHGKSRYCMICMSSINDDKLVVACPHCKSTFHRCHLLEWLKMKGNCPVCREPVNENELLKTVKVSLYRKIINYFFKEKKKRPVKRMEKLPRENLKGGKKRSRKEKPPKASALGTLYM